MITTADQLALLAFLLASEPLPLDKTAVLEVETDGIVMIAEYPSLLACMVARDMHGTEGECVTDEGEF